MHKSLRAALPIEDRNDESWLSFLEEHGLVSWLSGSGDRSKVVAPSEMLWDWYVGQRRDKEAFQLLLVDPGDQSQSGLVERPKTPADFLSTLRQQRARSRTEFIRSGPYSIPAALHKVAESIGDSRHIVDLEDNWDEDGSPGYEEATWTRATRLVVEMSIAFWRTYHVVPPTPLITPGPDGSIDMVWRTAERKLAINIPANPENVATFYGKDRNLDDGFVRGEFQLPREAEWLLAWLTR